MKLEPNSAYLGTDAGLDSDEVVVLTGDQGQVQVVMPLEKWLLLRDIFEKEHEERTI